MNGKFIRLAKLEILKILITRFPESSLDDHNDRIDILLKKINWNNVILDRKSLDWIVNMLLDTKQVE